MAKPEVTLPPPPTRPRKIIQMKPKESQRKDGATLSGMDLTPADAPRPSSSHRSRARAKSGHAGTASKKTARKTAHSIIERRRRFKMNEEFETLKTMIPACRGQAMHKLAILQAGIDYLRYLEKCVADLSAAGQDDSGSNAALLASAALAVGTHLNAPTPGSQGIELAETGDGRDEDSDMKADEDFPDRSEAADTHMDGFETIAPPDAVPTLSTRSPLATNHSGPPSQSGPTPSAYNSPALHSQSRNHSNHDSPVIWPQPSQSSFATSNHRHQSSLPASSTSTNAGLQPLSTLPSTANDSTWSSPASAVAPTEASSAPDSAFSLMTPVGDASPRILPGPQSLLLGHSAATTAAGEQEATAALLLLNCDRRESRSERRVALSVKELLSS